MNIFRKQTQRTEPTAQQETEFNAGWDLASVGVIRDNLTPTQQAGWDAYQKTVAPSVAADQRALGEVVWSGTVALIAAFIVALSLLQPARADSGYPTPTPSVWEPPHMIYRVWLPMVPAESEEVHGCDDCQVVSWCPGCNPAAS